LFEAVKLDACKYLAHALNRQGWVKGTNGLCGLAGSALAWPSQAWMGDQMRIAGDGYVVREVAMLSLECGS